MRSRPAPHAFLTAVGLLVSIAGVALGPVAEDVRAAAAPTFVRESTFTGGPALGIFGSSVAVSKDGNVVLVGAPSAYGYRGAAWLYKRSGQSWSTVRLLGPQSSLGFGSSVAISADGRIGLIGAPGDQGGAGVRPGKGAVFAYNLTGQGGLYVGARLPVTGVKGKAGFGTRISLSADGRTAVVGGPHDDGDRGAAWLFRRTGSSTWQQLKKVTALPTSRGSMFGLNVAIAANASAFVVGAPYERGGKGGVWLFYMAPSGSVVAYPPRRTASSFHPFDQTGNSRFGLSLAMSADGTQFIVGAPFDNGSRGAVWMYESTQGVYLQKGKKVTPRDASGAGRFGAAVALSADAGSALVGGPADGSNKGAVWVFSAGLKTYPLEQVGPKLAGGTGAQFGASIALNPEGNRALLGAPGNGGGKGAAFIFVDRPAVEAVNPNAGPIAGGTEVRIVGSGFAGVKSVVFGSTPATSFKVVSRTLITAVSPAHPPGKIAVKVTTNLGTSAVPLAGFTYLRPPFVSMITPNSGPPGGGTEVTITGLDFVDVTSVTFGNAEAAFKVDSPTQIRAQAPPGSGVVDVRVTSAGGISSTSAASRFTYGDQPSILSISPSQGPAAGGTEVTITGANLGGATSVSFGSAAAASFTVDSASQIRAVSPAGDGAVDITVATPLGTSAVVPAARFTYVNPPMITAVNPNAGPVGGGTQVAITGLNLAGTTAVSFGATPAASFTVDSPTQVRAVSPAGQNGTVDITLRTAVASTTRPAAFTYYTMITFDGLVTGGPGQANTTVLAQYNGQGVSFNNLSAIDYSKGSGALPNFAHSGTIGVEGCIGTEFCTTPLIASFTNPQRTVCAWVGFSYPLNAPIQVQLQARDASSAVIGTVSATLATEDDPTPIRTPLQVTVGGATITQIRVLVSGGFNGGLALDDVTFTTGAGPLAVCQ